MIPQTENYGPAMRALTPKMRSFVEHFVDIGRSNASEAYRRAGYSTNSGNAVRVESSKLLQNEKVKAALQEYATGRMTGMLPGALQAAAQIVEDESLKPQDRLAAAKIIFGATGLGTRQTIDVNHNGKVEYSFADAQRLVAQMRQVGLPQLPSPVIEDAECVEVIPEGDF
jgi:phage terminase small subunit